MSGAVGSERRIQQRRSVHAVHVSRRRRAAEVDDFLSRRHRRRQLGRHAIDAVTGDIAWTTTLGINEHLPAGKQNVGGSGSAGPSVTAGGLVFIGATDDRRFRAFDSKSGKELWAARLDAAGNANPISYQAKNGKQYVAIVATNQLVVFALP